MGARKGLVRGNVGRAVRRERVALGSARQSPKLAAGVAGVRMCSRMRRPFMTLRRGFTLIELLVVIAVIATLAGLLIPAVTMIKSKSNDVKCSNNLRQIATGMLAYALDYEDNYPSSVHLLMQPQFGRYGLAGLPKLLICPRDHSKGTDAHMGRSYFHSTSPGQDLSYLHEPGMSYMYETSEKDCAGEPFHYFYQYSPAIDKPAEGSVSWLTAKQNQLAYGWTGNPLPQDRFPVLRCFHHHSWNGQSGKVAKVNNVSWNGNIFWSVISWEYHIDPSLTPWLN